MLGLAHVLACKAAPAPSNLGTNNPVQQAGRVYLAAITNHQPITNYALPRSNFHPVVNLPVKPGLSLPAPPTNAITVKISPTLKKWLESPELAGTADLLVTFQEDLKIPLLPPPPDKQPLDAVSRAEVVQGIRAKRRESQSNLLAQLEGTVTTKIELVDSFWLANAIRIRVPLTNVQDLARLKPVVYLQPAQSDAKSPQTTPPDGDANDPAAAREILGTDLFAELGLDRGRFALLDAGVRATHIMLTNRLDVLMDCTRPGGCVAEPQQDDAKNHGTPSAAILSGNDQSGNRHRGVTQAPVDSYRVADRSGNVHPSAVAAAIDCAAERHCDVLLIQAAVEEEDGAIAQQADRAYDAGMIVIAANGNAGTNGVRSPALAHKVIGVGCFSLPAAVESANTATLNPQSVGPAADGRFKPDVQAPTGSETASSRLKNNGTAVPSDVALGAFGDTSGAAPFAAAVALLWKNWVQQFGPCDNGQVYALLILSGQSTNPYSNDTGAGPLKMPGAGVLAWGKLEIQHREYVDIPFQIESGRTRLKAALWWPEGVFQRHNDIDLAWSDPSGGVRGEGNNGVSVFEKAVVDRNVVPGSWTLRVTSYDVPASPQSAYWAVHIE